ncbi:MAG: hypothetical protein NTY19_01225 [Planctomycetota bacterium]|nr:hypothetical protein [Planctomycetota bacterium]
MLRDDLVDAGIEPVDDDGRVVDFHGQRTTFITGLARAGVVPAMAQQLARHSDIKLTMGTYTRLTMQEMAAAVGTLPEIHLGGKPATSTAPSPPVSPDVVSPDAELCRVVGAWPNLPGHIRQAILALLTAAGKGTPDQGR